MKRIIFIIITLLVLCGCNNTDEKAASENEATYKVEILNYNGDIIKTYDNIPHVMIMNRGIQFMDANNKKTFINVSNSYIVSEN